MSSSLPPVSTYPFPSDPFKTDGLTVSGAQSYAGAPRRLSIWGGTVLSITPPVHTGSASGNSDVEIVVKATDLGVGRHLRDGGRACREPSDVELRAARVLGMHVGEDVVRACVEVHDADAAARRLG